jgi:16S rRNA (guanine1207-N2)-methyltransferase
LFLGAEPHPALAPSVVGWQPFRPMATAWENSGRPLESTPPEKRFPVVLILPGKSRDETLAWFAIARDHLSPGGTIFVSMPNTSGASRFEKEFAKATSDITSFQKNKCRAFHATDNGNWDESQFDAWRAHTFTKNIPNTHFVTQAGVFSSDHIDPGSQLLIEHLPKQLHGRIADLGAGWGFLSDHVLTHCPKINQIDLFEADSRALECARKNLSHHTAKINYHWHDVTTGLPEKYDTIITNPPFHTGQATHVDLGRAFLTTATQSLKSYGQLFIVANRQLPYEATLTSLGLRWKKTAENPAYKLLFAQKI